MGSVRYSLRQTLYDVEALSAGSVPILIPCDLASFHIKMHSAISRTREAPYVPNATEK